MVGEGNLDSVPASTLAGRLERLFEVRRPTSDRTRPWRNSEVVSTCRSAGRELSESHLSELRRGVKTNPTMRTLETLAWFFEVPTGYFTDSALAAATYAQLAADQAALQERVAGERRDQEERTAAARELRDALRASGVTRAAHRGASAKNAREQASMMRALAKALRDDDAQGEQAPAGSEDSD